MNIGNESPVLILPFFQYVFNICKDAILDVAKTKVDESV